MDEEIEDFLEDAMVRVTKLRYGLPTLGPESSHLYVLEVIGQARTNLDQIEEILLQIVRMRGKLKRATALAQASYDDAWDKESKKQRANIAARMGDFVAPKERYADVNLMVLEKTRALRKAAAIEAVANDAYEYIKTAYWGLDGTRRDMLALLTTYRNTEGQKEGF